MRMYVSVPSFIFSVPDYTVKDIGTLVEKRIEKSSLTAGEEKKNRQKKEYIFFNFSFGLTQGIYMYNVYTILYII